MKKSALLNSRLSYIVAEMGHTDTLCVSDAGLPFPGDAESIDLAVAAGVPSLLDVLDAVLSELQVEDVTLALETREKTPALFESIKKRFPGVTIRETPHEEFKKMTARCSAVVRTGECVPYSNIILHAGVTF